MRLILLSFCHPFMGESIIFASLSRWKSRTGQIITRSGWPKRTTSCGWPTTTMAFRSAAWAWFRPMPTPACSCRIPGTLNIMHAYTEPAWRGHGIAAALRAQAISAGRAQGYVRCAVDFESPNITAARFWIRHFRPVCYSVIRVVS